MNINFCLHQKQISIIIVPSVMLDAVIYENRFVEITNCRLKSSRTFLCYTGCTIINYVIGHLSGHLDFKIANDQMLKFFFICLFLSLIEYCMCYMKCLYKRTFSPSSIPDAHFMDPNLPSLPIR